MNNEKHSEGQVWTCQQYSTSPHFSGIELCDPNTNGGCYAIPVPAGWDVPTIVKQQHMIDMLNIRKSRKYFKPMIRRCRRMNEEEEFIMWAAPRIRYEVYSIVEKNGFITETEFKEIVEKYKRELEEAINKEIQLKKTITELINELNK